MNLNSILSRASVSIGLSIFLLACSGQEKHPEHPAKPAPPSVNQAVAAPPAPVPSTEAAIPSPPPPPAIRFIPPVVTDEYDEKPPLQDEYNESYKTVEYDADYTVSPEPERPPVQEGPLEFVEEPAEYPGGMAALRKYLIDNLVYPQIAKEAGLQGKCYLKFVVSKTGDVSEVRVLRGVPDCRECDQEAVRLVKAMPKWKPGKQNGKAVDSYFNLPVSFKLQ